MTEYRIKSEGSSAEVSLMKEIHQQLDCDVGAEKNVYEKHTNCVYLQFDDVESNEAALAKVVSALND